MRSSFSIARRALALVQLGTVHAAGSSEGRTAAFMGASIGCH